MAWTSADRIASNSRFHFFEPQTKAPRTTRKTYLASRFVTCNCVSISSVVQTHRGIRLHTEYAAEYAQPAGLSTLDCHLRVESNVIFDIARSIGRSWVVPSNIVSLLALNVKRVVAG